MRQYSLDRYGVKYRHMGKMRLYKPKAGKQSSPAFRMFETVFIYLGAAAVAVVAGRLLK
jgi:hypothetical protein